MIAYLHDNLNNAILLCTELWNISVSARDSRCLYERALNTGIQSKKFKLFIKARKNKDYNETKGIDIKQKVICCKFSFHWCFIFIDASLAPVSARLYWGTAMIHLHIPLLKALITKSISSLKGFSMHICMNRMHPELMMIQYWVPWVLHSHLSLVTSHISLYVNVWMNRLYLFSSGSLTPVSQMLPIGFTHNILIGRVTPSYLIARNRVSNRCNFLVLGSEFSISVVGSF